MFITIREKRRLAWRQFRRVFCMSLALFIGIGIVTIDAVTYDWDQLARLRITPAVVPDDCDETATGVTKAEVEAMLADVDAGETGCIPAGTETWASGVEWTAPANATILGAGNLSVVGGGDATVINAGFSLEPSNAFVLAINISSTGVFRMAGLSFTGATDFSTIGAVRISGSGGAQFRIDHIHMETQGTQMRTAGQIYGVIDSSIFDVLGATALRFHANDWGGADFGDGSWSDDTTLGSERFVFLEDNEINAPLNGGVQDCYQAPRFVIRYNEVLVAATQTHPTGGSNRARGCRAWEIYGNTFTADNGDAQQNVFFMSSGTGVVWGNSAPEGYTHFITGHSVRRTWVSYPQTLSPGGWGNCGPPQASGVLDVTDTGGGSYRTVTRVSGDNFDVTWPATSMIHITGAACTGGQSGPRESCYITSVGSTSALTLTTSTGGALNDVAWATGSPWDGNTNVEGYPCLDQPGRGKTDAMSGDFPVAINDTTKTASWPNQLLEPVYIWGNTWTTAGGGNFVDAAGTGIDDNRDYYKDVGASCVAGGACTTGVGSGTSLPTTCTVGVAFWRTDESKLYKCTSSNTFTLYYTPYTYPHPLRQ